MSLSHLSNEELCERGGRFVSVILKRKRNELQLKQNYLHGNESVAGAMVESLADEDAEVVKVCEYAVELAKRLRESERDRLAMDELAELMEPTLAGNGFQMRNTREVRTGANKAEFVYEPDYVEANSEPFAYAQIAKRKK